MDIEEGPYSLMMHENFILAGGYHGHIHMIDINNDNLCEFSNRLSYGLIVHMQKYETKTMKQRNPYLFKSLAWSAWIIARIGSWSGYAAQGPPGYITIKSGYDKFMNMLTMYELLKKDV